MEVSTTRLRATGSGFGILLACALFASPIAQAHGGAHPKAPTDAQDFAVPEPGSYTLAKLGPATDGRVLRHDSEETSLAAVITGKYVFLSFIYTQCGDADGCPLATAVLQRVQRQVALRPSLKHRTQIVSLSFDPVRDTPPVMAEYAKAFAGGSEPHWSFLTTRDQRALGPILDGFGQQISEEWDREGQTLASLSHLLRVFLIDREGIIRNIYGAETMRAEMLLADLSTLALEDGARPPAASARTTGQRIDLAGRSRTPPTGLPPLPVPENNPLTEAKVDLGRRLFFDRRLSHNDTVSCGICHIPGQGFSNNDLATSVGIEGRTVRRNAPSLFNVGYNRRLMLDGRERGLEEQIWSPLLAHNEMGNPGVGALLEKIAALEDYSEAFAKVFPGEGLTMGSLGMALASYQRGLLSADSPFDRWRFDGDEKALSESAKRGFSLFVGKGACATCHLVENSHALFTDHDFHNTGIGYAAAEGPRASTQQIQVTPERFLEVERKIIDPVTGPVANDLGRYEITGDPADRYSYRTPSLRNVALSAPYMHDGSLKSLDDVVAFYDDGGIENPLLDDRIRRLQLTQSEREDLVAFLMSLTGGDVGLLVADALSQSVGERGAPNGD